MYAVTIVSAECVRYDNKNRSGAKLVIVCTLCLTELDFKTGSISMYI